MTGEIPRQLCFHAQFAVVLSDESDFPRVFVIKGCNGNDAENTTFGYFDWYHNTGFVQSTNYPSNYPNNQDCRWFIKVAPGYRIQVTVKHADIAYATHGGSLGDSLQVDDGRTFTSSHDHLPPWTFLSTGSLVRVRFESDSLHTESGFYLRYERGIENFGILSFVVIFCACSCFRHVRVIRKFACSIHEGYVVFAFLIMPQSYQTN